MNTDDRVDVYIENAAEFAQPILIRIRELVHASCPNVEETIKWGFPHFDYKGPFMHMAAFKGHVALGFWKAKIMEDPAGIFGKEGSNMLSQFGRIQSMEDFPDKEIIKVYMEQAIDINDRGIKLPTQPKKDKKELIIPTYIKEALNSSKLAKETFENFAYSHQKEYIEWIEEAKRDETKQKRIATMMLWLEEGKSKNWKYER